MNYSEIGYLFSGIEKNNNTIIYIPFAVYINMHIYKEYEAIQFQIDFQRLL